MSVMAIKVGWGKNRTFEEKGEGERGMQMAKKYDFNFLRRWVF